MPGPIRYRLMPPGNPLAMWSVIVGIAGFCIPFVGGAAAIVLGIFGVIRSGKVLEGRSAGITGIVLGTISVACSYAVYTGIAAICHALQ